MKFQVIFAQVNQVAIEVDARDEAEAGDRAARKWRREYGEPHEIQVRQIKAVLAKGEA